MYQTIHRILLGVVCLAILYLLLALIVAGVDQIIKYFVLEYLVTAGRVTAIPHILDLIYVENTGVAFGMFSNLRWLFVIVTAFVILAFVIMLLRGGYKSKLFSISSVLIIGGGFGNLIDRIIHGFVVDYLQLSFFSPVCNFADYCITVGTVLLVVYLIFYSDLSKDNNKKEIENNE